MKRIWLIVLILLAICLFLFQSGCGYSLHGRASLPFNAVHIEKIENRTFEPKLEDRLHKALTEELLRKGIVVKPDAEYKLSGVIRYFELRILSEKLDIASEYEVIIKGDFIIAGPSGETKEYKNIGSPFIVSFSGVSTMEEMIASKETASEKAIRDMAMEIVGTFLYYDRK